MGGAFWKRRLAEDGGDDVVHHKGRAVGQSKHVEELHGRPLPAVGFAADHGHGGRALHGEGEEDHEGECAAERHVVVQSGLQVEGLRARVGAVELSLIHILIRDLFLSAPQTALAHRDR